MPDLPNFICIGAQRAGTTWLHNCLNEHPDVFVPHEKELHFFDRFYSDGIESYKENFSPELRGSAKTWGEITPNYYQEPNSLERIKSHIPEVKIIYILREPAARAFSQYQLYTQNKIENIRFQDFIDKNPSAIDLSLQGEHLNRALSLFDRPKVLILFYDELVENPVDFIKKVYLFIGVDPEFKPTSLKKRINRIVLPGLQEKLKKMGLTWLIDLIKASPFSELVKEIAHRKHDQTGNNNYPKDVQKKFNADIKKIEETLKINLSHWR
ncbi:MAG: sulfotransferase [Spongiibacteraceae bacterium]